MPGEHIMVAFPSLSLPTGGTRTKRIFLIVAMTLSVAVNLAFLFAYLHGGSRSAERQVHLPSRAGVRPNATQYAAVQDAEETTAELLEAEERAKILLEQILEATNRSDGAPALHQRRRAAQAAPPASSAGAPLGGLRWLLWMVAVGLYQLVRTLLLLSPGLLALAFALGSYLQAQPAAAATRRRHPCTCTHVLLHGRCRCRPSLTSRAVSSAPSLPPASSSSSANDAASPAPPVRPTPAPPSLRRPWPPHLRPVAPEPRLSHLAHTTVGVACGGGGRRRLAVRRGRRDDPCAGPLAE